MNLADHLKAFGIALLLTAALAWGVVGVYWLITTYEWGYYTLLGILVFIGSYVAAYSYVRDE